MSDEIKPPSEIDALLEEAQSEHPPLEPGSPHAAAIEELERKLSKAKSDARRQQVLYGELKKKYEELSAMAGIIDQVGSIETIKIEPSKGSGNTEAVALLVASDWHVEESVDPETVNGLNKYNLEISARRAEEFFRSGLKLTQIVQRDVHVGTIVLPLLGDFITNDIHEELMETNELLPIEATMQAQTYIASGIQFLLEHTDCKIILPCHSGNHGRTTKYVHAATEHGHSLEYFMFKNLEREFLSEPRVEFRVSRSYHSYLEVFGLTVRVHHGNAINYYGGVGDIYISANKAIADWNRARHADLDIFGHHHRQRDGSDFLSNGSLIGFNAYAVRIKARYEPPRQVFTVIDNKRGRTMTCPIYVERSWEASPAP